MEENLNLVAGSNIELIRTGDEVSVNNTYEYDDSGIEEEIQQIEASLETYSLITETGSKVQIELNNTNYKMKIKLFDKNDNLINTSNEVDLPIEQLVKSITYDSETKEIVFTLQNGTQTRVPLSDLISGLVTEEQLDSEVEKLQAEIDSYKTIFNALPKVEGEGETLTLDGTANSVMKMNLKGNTSQDTTTGKNLLPMFFDTTSLNGITLTNNGDGTYTINGTASANTNLIPPYNNWIMFGENATYYFSANYLTDITYALYKGTSDLIFWKTANGTFSLSESASNVRLVLVIPSGAVFNNQILKLQIEKGSSATDYEEYTGGIASPNSDYPQDVHTINGDNTIKVYGKNLFSSKLELGALNGDGVNADSSTRVRSKDKIYLEAGTYTLNCLGGTSIVAYQYDNGDIDTTGTALSNGWVSIPFTFTLNSNKYIRFAVQKNNQTITINDITNSMLNEGSSPLPYQPYQSNSVLLTLGDKEICKIGNYEDKIFKAIKGNEIYDSLSVEEKNTLDYGKWYLRKAIGKVVLNGSEDISREQISNGYYKFYINNILNVDYGDTNYIPKIMSDKLVAVGRTTMYLNTQGITSANNNLQIYTDATKTMVISDFRTWLGSNNITAYYGITTPTNELFNDAQQEQLEDIYNNMISYEGQTNISQVNNDLPFIITASALRDLSSLDGE